MSTGSSYKIEVHMKMLPVVDLGCTFDTFEWLWPNLNRLSHGKRDK